MTTENFRENERDAAIKKAQQRKRRRRKKQTVLVLLLILFVALITLVVLSLTVFFKTAEIQVLGSNMYTAEEIISAAEINIGDNLFRISENKVSARLQKHLPYIINAEIKRVLPDTLRITVTETTEEICFTNGTACFSADKKGKLIEEYSLPPEDLITITVSDSTGLNVGENVQFATERETELFNKFIQKIDEYGYKVDFINISDPYSSYMKIEGRLIVKFGSVSYFDNKAAYLSASLSSVSKNATGVFDLSSWTPENNQTVLTYGDISDYEK